jgi:hypothetical protein
LRAQGQFLRRQLALGEAPPVSRILTEDLVAQALTEARVSWIDRIFSPLITPWAFLSQVLSADHSCRAAVARPVAHRAARGQKPCAGRAGAYCQARARLPERLYPGVARSVGRAPGAQAKPGWLWEGRRVYLSDGTALSPPDAPENQAACPRVYNQKPGPGFAIARLGALIPLPCGAIVHLGVCPHAGKGQGEVGLLRTLWDIPRPRDTLLADRLRANWTNLQVPQERGIDFVGRLNKANRTADFRRGKRLGPYDHPARWRKPTSIRSLGRQAHQALPASVTIREAKSRVPQPGFRTKALVVVTTLLGPRQTTTGDLAALCRARWNDELDLRAVKSAMQMADLRRKTPELVRKEIWAHVSAYNRLRTVMAQAAATHGLEPRPISFKGALQALEAFRPLPGLTAAEGRGPGLGLYQHLLRAIASHGVGDRPDRFEPRAKKRRRDHYAWLTKPRSELKRKMAKGATTT